MPSIRDPKPSPMTGLITKPTNTSESYADDDEEAVDCEASLNVDEAGAEVEEFTRIVEREGEGRGDVWAALWWEHDKGTQGLLEPIITAENLDEQPVTTLYEYCQKKGKALNFKNRKKGNKVVLEPAMQGRDMIGRVKTGTGKTLAFGIPIMDKILQDQKKNGFSVLCSVFVGFQFCVCAGFVAVCDGDEHTLFRFLVCAGFVAVRTGFVAGF
ncbi:uncharacterized protein A4U43_C07F11600 [Asparagus officinalis]|uniref:DEAD/DEAH-box helicase domain-containing protein n=1 Tax=Asparagus officinalis TaxID=4686 RepID=A0A5P1EB78_ASPOF|nr:uncharacterized protein A4U43_C07F11600 [Asparagus officinalis]